MHNTTAVEIPDTEQGSPEWLQARKAGVTASEVGAILGLSPFATPLSVWLSKQPDAEPTPQTEAMRWGHVHEPRILEAYAAEAGVWVMDGGGLLQSKDYPWMLASLDGWATSKDENQPWIVEAKTSGRSFDYPPDTYIAQVQWQMATTGLDRGDIAVLFRGNRLEVWSIDRDQDWIDQARDYCHEWFNTHVVGGVAPDPVLPADAPNLAKAFPAEWGAESEIPPELWAQFVEAMEAAKAAQLAAADAKAAIQLVMRESTEATVDGQTVGTWRPTKPRRTVDVSALKRDGIYDDYTTEKDGARMFRITTRKEAK